MIYSVPLLSSSLKSSRSVLCFPFVFFGFNQAWKLTLDGMFSCPKQTAFPSTTFVVGEDECHNGPIISLMIGDQSETEQGKAYASFLLSKL